MVFSAIAGAIGTVFGLGAFATKIVAGTLAIGAQFLLTKRGQSSPKKRLYTAYQSEKQYGTSIPLQSAFGTVMTKGHEVRYFVWGAGDKFNASVIQLSDFECDGLEPYVFMNGEKYALIAKDIIGNETEHWGIDGFENLTSIRFYSGSADQEADAKLISDTANLGSKWKSTAAGEGVCYLIFEREYASAWEFEPDPSWVLRGLKLYDPRKDDTVSGGSGTHRIDDPTTWEFTKNPSIQRYNFLYGLRSPVTGLPVIGAGKSQAQIDINAHIAAANTADTERVISGNTVKTYECNTIVEATDDFSEVLETFDDAMAGYSLNKGGIASVIAGAPQVATFEITDDDNPREGVVTTRPRRNLDNLINTLTGQYTNIEAQFSPDSLDTISVNADISEDNGIRQNSIDLLQITDPDIAQYVLQIHYRQNRKGQTVSLAITDRKYFAINAGDWGTYDGQTWMVLNKEDGTILLGEVGNDIYASEGIEPGPVPSVPATPVNPSLISQLQGFAVSAGFIQGTNGSSRPVLSVTWTDPEDPTITSIAISYNVQGSSTKYTVTAPDPSLGSFVIDQNVVSGQIYEVTALIQTQPDRFRQATGTVTTSTPTPDAAVVLEELQNDTKEVIRRHSDTLSTLRDVIDELTSAQQSTATDENIHRRELATRTDNTEALIVEEQQVRATADAALASDITLLSASVGDNAAAIVQEAVTRANAITAEAAARTAAIAEIDTEIAEGLFDIQAVAAPGGVEVRLAMLARASTGGSFEEAGVFIDVISDGSGGFYSTITNKADSFRVTDANDDLIFGTLGGDFVSNALIRSPDGKFVIDVVNKTIEITS